MLIPASFPGLSHTVQCGTEAGEEPGNKASYYNYISVRLGYLSIKFHA